MKDPSQQSWKTIIKHLFSCEPFTTYTSRRINGFLGNAVETTSKCQVCGQRYTTVTENVKLMVELEK